MTPSSKSKTVHVDEDVDDLDDVLDQFSPPPSKPAVPADSSKRSVPSSSSEKASDPPADNAFTDAFAEELAKEMESLLKGLGNGPSPLEKAFTATEEEEKLFKDAWDKILEHPTSTSASTAPANPAQSSQKGPEGLFQERIKQAMENMKQSQSSLRPSDSENNPDLEALLSSLDDPGIDGEDKEGLQGFLSNMMFQLISKEVLYEPLKEMHEKFPSYLSENENKLSQGDKNRYKKQQEAVSQIISIFDAEGYSDENAEDGLKVMSLMNEMQEHGAPPPEIMGELPPGMTLGPDGLPQLPEDCCVM